MNVFTTSIDTYVNMQTRIESFFSLVDSWTKWANHKSNRRFDIALLKIWIGFEKYISDIFVWYAMGRPSEKGYSPELKISFYDETQLFAFLKHNDKYIDFHSRIRELSKHIFKDDPFSRILIEDNKYSSVYAELVSLRNYIAHESGDSQERFVAKCLGGKGFIEPDVFLLKQKKESGKTFYSYYVDSLKDMVIAISSKSE